MRSASMVALVCLMLASCASRPAHPPLVSLFALVADPDRFHGKVVGVYGHASIGFENNELCPVRNPPSPKDCIWIQYDDGPWNNTEDMKRHDAATERWSAFDGKVILVFGEFDARKLGHLGMSSGTIYKITRVDAREGFDN